MATIVTDDEAKESARDRWIVAITTLGALLTLLVIAIIVVLIRASDGNTKPVATRFASPKAIVDELQPKLEGERLLISTASGMGGVTLQGYAAYTSPPYHADKNYQTTPSKSDGFGVESDIQSSKTNYQVASDFFAQHHFEKLASKSGRFLPIFLSEQYDFTVNDYDVYDSETIRCVVSRMDISAVQPDGVITGVGCADKTNYKNIARDIAPLYDAYVKSEGSEAKNILFGLPTERQGSDGYTNISVYQEIDQDGASQGLRSRNSLYYKSPQDNTVTFFTSIIGTPACAAFNTDVLLKAFKGYECFDEAKNSYAKV